MYIHSCTLLGGEKHHLFPLLLFRIPPPPTQFELLTLFLYPLTPSPPLPPQNLAAAPAINVSHGVCEIAKACRIGLKLQMDGLVFFQPESLVMHFS